MKYLAVVLLAIALLFPLLAGADQRKTEVEALWKNAMDEMRVVLTCGATYTKSDELIRREWDRIRGNSFAVMLDNGWSEADIAEIKQQSTAEALRLPGNTPYSEVLNLCKAHPNWYRQVNSVSFFPLEKSLKKLFTHQ